jgi:uncharacterized protein (DUF2267 family)
MEYEEIIEAIGREAADLPPDVAERAAQAVLQTLAERLPRGEARHILAELPAELKPWVYTEADAEGFGIDEFLERVARHEGTDIETALRHARAVFAALGRALDGGRAGKRGRGRGRAGGRGIQACPGGVRDAGRGG